MKIISDKRDLRVRQFLPTGANVNFQIAVALACLLDIPGGEGGTQAFLWQGCSFENKFQLPKIIEWL